MSTGFQQQQPLGFTAAVRSTPSPQQAVRLALDSARPAAPPSGGAEEKSFERRPGR
ncbi:MAG TPA: hypothetical protein VGM25_10420 [Caulobacteraceae bacterium]|jgi:hypothetical protein